MHSTGYIIRFIVALCAVSALLLAFLFSAFKERSDRNEAIFNKKAILKAVGSAFEADVDDLSDDDVIRIFNDQVEQYVLDMSGNEVDEAIIAARGYKGVLAEHIDMAKEKKRPEGERLLPLFIFNDDGEKYYIASVRGNGLWDEIWANVALEDDFNTVVGVSFDHKAETPGLGAEIKDNKNFPAQFVGKQISPEGVYTSVVVRKGGARNLAYEVDGISGATVTCDGVTEMLYRGIGYYQPYFEKMQ